MKETLESYLTRLEDHCSYATPGPWKFDIGNGQVETTQDRLLICERIGNLERKKDMLEMRSGSLDGKLKELLSHDNNSDMEFIALAREAVPFLLMLVRELGV